MSDLTNELLRDRLTSATPEVRSEYLWPAMAEEILTLRDRIQAVRDLHRKMPIYDTPIEDCDEHDSEVHGIELDDGEVYCDQHVSDYVCEHCADLDENCNTETSYPCPTIRALDGES